MSRSRFAAAVLLVLTLLSACTPLEDTGATIITPQALPFSANELANPGRGLYRWSDQKAIVPPEYVSDRDSYRRFRWDEFETAPGEYNFGRIDAFIEDSIERGQRAQVGFIQPVGPSSNGDSRMPAYLTNEKYGTWWNGTFWPDFNNGFVLERFEAMIRALGQRYNGDDRISMVQMNFYGAYGEYYVPGDAPDSVPRITRSNAQRVVKTYLTAFPDSQLTTLLGNSHGGHVMRAAILADRSIGWSRMALGCPSQMDNIDRLMEDPEIGAELRERWKYAPVWTEMIGQYSGDCGNQFAAAVDQVAQYHVSYVGNGNFREPFNVFPYNRDGTRNSKSIWTEANIRDFILAGKRAGYRYVVQQVEVGQAERGTRWQVRSTWRNDGSAPVYEPWQVQYELREIGGKTVWKSASQVNLRTVLPSTTGVQTYATMDTFTLPDDLPSATYRLHVVVPAISRYVKPLQLAIGGRQPDGSYYLGDVAVKRKGETPPPTLPPIRPAPTERPPAPLPPLPATPTPQPGAPTPVPRETRDTISFVGATSLVANDARTFTLARPDGVQAGDVLLAQVAHRSPEATLIIPGGWKLVRTDVQQTALVQSLYVRVAGEDEPETYTWRSDTSTDMGGGMLAYRGADTTQLVVSNAGESVVSDRVSLPDTSPPAGSRLVVFGSLGWGFADLDAPEDSERRYEDRLEETDITIIAADVSASDAPDRLELGADEDTSFIGQVAVLVPAPEIKSVAPSADTYVRDGQRATRNFGDDDVLVLRSSDAGPEWDRVVLLAFDLGGIAAIETRSAVLVLPLIEQAERAFVVDLYTTNPNWDEYEVVWNSRPKRGTLAASTSVAPEHTEVRYDVTPLVNAALRGNRRFAVQLYDSTIANVRIKFASRETVTPPTLLVELPPG